MKEKNEEISFDIWLDERHQGRSHSRGDQARTGSLGRGCNETGLHYEDGDGIADADQLQHT